MKQRLLTFLIVPAILALFGCTAADVSAPVFEGGKEVSSPSRPQPQSQPQSQTQTQPLATRSVAIKPVAGPPQSRVYVVKRGDTLYSIAWRENLDYRALATWNQLPSDYTIHPGQLLRLTKPPKSAYLAKKAVKTAKQPAARVVQPRSTLVKKTKPVASKSLPKRKGKLRWRWPTIGKVVKRFSNKKDARKGIHIAGRVGQPVYAAEQGKVVYSGSGLMGYGKLIIVKHDKYFLSAYGHNRKILVKEGSIVSAGQKIAEMGQSDKGQAMLHFEIRKNGKPVNPVRLLPRR